MRVLSDKLHIKRIEIKMPLLVDFRYKLVEGYNPAMG